MKIYRALPNIFVTKNMNIKENIFLEDIYYKMGYVSCPNKVGGHNFNTLNCENLIGKYFYLFAFDAIYGGYTLIHNYHRLRADTFLVLEYDVPEDIILKHIGYGDYTDGILPNLLIETFIEKEDFCSKIISSDKILEKEKLRYLVTSFKEIINALVNYKYCAAKDIEYYIKLFFGNNLSSISKKIWGFTGVELQSLTDKEISENIVNSEFYSNFLNNSCDLILSPYITNKTIIVNWNFHTKLYDNMSNYYQNLGIRFEEIEEYTELKEELLYSLSQNQDKETIRKLLKSKDN